MPNPPLKHLPLFQEWVAKNYVTDDDDGNSSKTSHDNKDKSAPAAGPYSGIAKTPTAFPRLKRGAGISGVSTFLQHFERTQPPARKINPTPKSIKEDKIKSRKAENEIKIAPLIEAYRQEQRDCSGEYTNGMNCYNTLFVGRLAYEVTERKLLREMESYGAVKDLKLITNKETGKSCGFAFVEYEHEEDMKRAYRAADGMRLEGRSVVVDVERGHTVPNWLPRKLGGGLGGTRLGGKDMNVVMAGRYDPSKQPAQNAMMGPGPGMGMGHNGGPPPGMNNGGGPPPGYGNDRGGGGGFNRGGPPMGRFDDRGPPQQHGYGGGGGYGGDNRGGGGGYNRGGPPMGRFDDRGPPQQHGYGGGGGYGGDNRGDTRGGGGGYGDRGGGGRGGPPPSLAWERGGGGGGNGGGGGGAYGGDRKRRRSRSRSPDRRRGRY